MLDVTYCTDEFCFMSNKSSNNYYYFFFLTIDGQKEIFVIICKKNFVEPALILQQETRNDKLCFSFVFMPKYASGSLGGRRG